MAASAEVARSEAPIRWSTTPTKHGNTTPTKTGQHDAVVRVVHVGFGQMHGQRDVVPQ